MGLKITREEAERCIGAVQKAVEQGNRNILGAAATALNISPSTLKSRVGCKNGDGGLIGRVFPDLKVNWEAAPQKTLPDYKGYFDAIAEKQRRYTGEEVEEPKPETPTDPIIVRRLKEKAASQKLQIADLERRASEAEAALDDIKVLCQEPPRPTIVLKEKSESDAASGRRAIVLQLSDLQHGETILLEEMDGLNSFNADISRRRVGRYFETVADLASKHWNGPPPTEIILVLGGDNISGSIHDELRATDSPAVPRQVKEAGEIIAGGIVHLAKTVCVPIRVYAIPGNHGRITHKPWSKQRSAASLDLLAAEFADIAVRAAGVEGVVFNLAHSPDAYFSVFEWRFIANHGDSMGGRGGGTGFIGPGASIIKGHRKLIDTAFRSGRPVHYALTHHYHTTIRTPFGYGNGSIPGYSDYARDLRCDPEPAKQNMLIVHEHHGVIAHNEIYLGLPSEGSLYRGADTIVLPASLD